MPGDRAPTPEELARQIGEVTAGPAAADVDRDARFPVEAAGELRRAGLLAALVPVRLGGLGATVADLARAVAALAEHCASSALVLAMHQIQVACVLRHGSEALVGEIAPRLVAGELLLANANSEVGLGGDRRSSICALEKRAGGFHLDKLASTVSYGEHADGILATARRHPGSPAHDQVLAVCLPPRLERRATGRWDTLGLRGTCSRPCHLEADLPGEHVIEDYASVFVRTSLPVSAILLGSVWLGLAEAAARKAHHLVRARAQARRGGAADTPDVSALRLGELGVTLHQLRAVLDGGARAYEGACDADAVETFQFSAEMDDLKIASSTLALEVVQRAMAICGLAGYDNGSPYTLGRILRDVTAAPLMVSNDRALQAMARTIAVRKIV